MLREAPNRMMDRNQRAARPRLGTLLLHGVNAWGGYAGIVPPVMCNPLSIEARRTAQRKTSIHRTKHIRANIAALAATVRQSLSAYPSWPCIREKIATMR
jgi:hypothetical protein